MLPSTVEELDVCPIPYIHPILYSKFSKHEDLPDASGWEEDDTVMKVCGSHWCKDAPVTNVSRSFEQTVEEKRK